jgi:2-polyprenyl-3-methyl-5-hydroxy-6-metoxy-1,4-benzoquinol methylase
MVHHHSCPLCLSEKVAIKFSCSDHFISKEVFQIAQCRDCGFQFTQDAPDEKELGRYYESEDYISHSNTSKGLSNKLYRFARSFMLRRKLAIVNKITVSNRGSLLDIGSGTGHFADTMKRAGWQVKGIEINEKASEFSQSQFGLDVISPDQIASLGSESFDCITLWHVLEHFHNPYEYAADIHRILKPGGVCLIALPNSNSFDAIHYGKYWAAYDVPRHLWHFNPATLKLFAEKSGFKVSELKTLPLDVFYISILSEKYSGSHLSFLSGIAIGKMYAFASFFKKERSSSVIYILKKL